MNIFLYVFTFFFYRTINGRRAKKWDSMPPEVCLFSSYTLSMSHVACNIGTSRVLEDDSGRGAKPFCSRLSSIDMKFATEGKRETQLPLRLLGLVVVCGAYYVTLLRPDFILMPSI